MSVQVKRPKDAASIKRLIRERERNIARLTDVLALPLPAQDRRHLQHRLHGEKMSCQAWKDYLAKQGKKGKR